MEEASIHDQAGDVSKDRYDGVCEDSSQAAVKHQDRHCKPLMIFDALLVSPSFLAA